ncbi:glycoside hydrolase family 20 zincin-like fold domain-containing protein [Algoriphagus sp. CAU 1675]|uniref:glycoside hydrolase family 20 zincin-like fold domain-containing protein n=1 Tax=Algoriphagus sp. CAU 1675 TaxID=3032597 RepID=UPI0023D9B1E4|nr:glycoside hydrolase family 20 zincin-like fold domain-containing protein [Algoriphagus sp. CAU 1675]MDF2159331.1 glycoside hydrolase family 20 zincin-like fold domain-containing protein [Algoriphagus sp. CAU 1675]
MNYSRITFFLFWIFPFATYAQIEESLIEVSWQYLENSPNEPAGYRAMFEITNHSGADLEAGWSLYFKSPFLLGEVQSENPDFQIRHLTAGLFVIEGRPISPALLPGKSFKVFYSAYDSSLKTAPTPEGLILKKSDGSYFEIGNYKILKMSLQEFEGAGMNTSRSDPDRRSYSQTPPFVPIPKQWKYLGTSDTVSNAGLVVLGDKVFSNEAKFLTGKISQAYKPEIDRAEKPLQIRIAKRDEIPSEGYKLEIRDRRVLILASDTMGAFNGVHAFLALMPEEFWDGPGSRMILPQVEIEDFPILHKD